MRGIPELQVDRWIRWVIEYVAVATAAAAATATLLLLLL
jgi:hypothetical protein